MTVSEKTPSPVSAARWSTIQGVFGILIQFGTLAVLARILDPEIFGAMAVLLVIQSIATLFAQLGLSSALIQRADLTRSALDSLYWLNIGLGVVVTLALILIAPLISAAFGMPELTRTTTAIAATFFVSSWSIQYQALAQKQLRFRRIAFINIASLLAAGTVSILMAWRGFGLWSLVLGVVVATSVRTACFLASGLRDNGAPSLHFNWGEARSLVVFGAHRFGAMLANAANSRIDQILVGSLLGAQALGFYSIANRVVLQPTDLTNPIVTRVAFPWLSRLQEDNEKLSESYLKIIGLVTAVNAPVLVAAAVLAEWVVPVLLGPGWDAAIALIQILSGYALLRSVINAGGSLILAKGRADWTFYWNLFLLLLYPAALYVAAGSGSLQTLALTLACLQVFVVILYHRFLIQPLTGIRFGRFLAVIGPPILSALAAGLLAYFAVQLAGQSANITKIVLGATVGAVAYVILGIWLMPRQLATVRTIVFNRRPEDRR